jgi:hypothetical protein
VSALARTAGIVRLAIVGAALGLAAVVSGCGELQGLNGPSTPLVTFSIVVNGDIASVRPAGIDSERALQVALVWGDQWLTEPFCLPTQHPDAADTVVMNGCRDPFGFVPLRVGANVPVAIGVPTTISLQDLPSTDLMVGDLSSRVAYASLVVYDDRDGDGKLELALPHRLPSAGPGPPQMDTNDSPDIVYGASFLTMTAPDQRIGYLEGFYTPSAFYPRKGCDPSAPPAGFSVLSAGGFSAADAFTLFLQGMLPPEDPTTCGISTDPPDQLINIPIQGPAVAAEAGCMERTDDSSTRYRQPPFDKAPDVTGRDYTCAPLPSFEKGDQPDLTQLVITGRIGIDRCMGLTHYTLRGCRNNVACAVPQWDYTANPPPWWGSLCPQ